MMRALWCCPDDSPDSRPQDLLRGETIKLNRESSNLTTNLEVRIGAAADGTWVKLPISAVDGVTASAALPAGRPLPTAVRYAFYDNPACPAAYDAALDVSTAR